MIYYRGSSRPRFLIFPLPVGLCPCFLSCYGFVNRGSVKPDSIVCFLCLRSSVLSLTLCSCPLSEACAIALYGFFLTGTGVCPR
nr:MAG TPA: hypothetical protein [Caudoviricetes sp.]